MSDPNDVWQNEGGADRERDDNRDRSPAPRVQERERSPRRERERSRSPARNGGGGGGGGGGPPQGGDDRAARTEIQNQGNNLHVSGIARNIDERMLEDLFSTAGKVYKAEIMLDPHSRESRGFGFVKMDTPEDANAAIEKFNGSTQEGKVMTVAHARRGRARTPTPGRYHGVKIEGGPGGYGDRGGGGGGRYQGGGGGGFDRPYQPRSYDSRYAERGPPRGSYDDRRYDDRRGDDRGGSRYDERPRYDDRPRYEDRGAPGGGGRGGDDGRGPPPIDRDPYYSDRRERSGAYERRDERTERPRYEERPSRY